MAAMTSNVFTQHKHIDLHSNKGMVDLSFYKVRCLILINRVLPGKNSARLLLVCSFSQKRAWTPSQRICVWWWCSVFFLLGSCSNWNSEPDSSLVYYILKQLVCFCFHFNHYKYCSPLSVLHIYTDVVKSRVFLGIHSRGVLELTLKINTWPTSNFSIDAFVLF